MSASHQRIDIGLSDEQRSCIAAGLSKVLADSSVLYGNTHGFHGIVTCPMFNTFHVLFMEQYTELTTALVNTEERIRAISPVY